jgi:hypothetical protein
MASVKGVCIITLETGKGRIKHFPARHDDHVQAGRDLMTPENLPSEASRAIPFDRSAKPSAGRYTQARDRASIRGDEQRHETRRDANT